MNYGSVLSKLLLLPSLSISINLLSAVNLEASTLANAAISDTYRHTENNTRDKQLLAQTIECVDYLDCNFQSCDRVGGDVICKMILTANQDTKIYVYNSSRAFDRFGNEYPVKGIILGNSNNSNSNRVDKDMLQGVGVKLEVSFSEIPTEIQNFTGLDIRLYNQKLVFRDVPIN